MARELALKLPGAKSFGAIRMAHLRELASRVGEPPERTESVVRDTLESMRRAWPELRSGTELLPAHADTIVAHWDLVPLSREQGGLT